MISRPCPRRDVRHALLGYAAPLVGPAVVAWAAALTPGCLFNAAVPGDAVLKCATDDDCVDGKSCNTSSGFCVKAVGSDGVAPALSSVSVAPPAGAAGAVITVSFTVSEPLLTAPNVVVNAGTAFARLALASGEAAASATPSFTFTYRVDGTEREGEAPILVDLVDVSGNAAHALTAGVVRFDFTPPTVVDESVALELVPAASNPLVSVGAAARGTTARVHLSVAEAVVASPAPTLTSAPAMPWALDAQSGAGGADLVFSHVFDGSEGADGPVSLTLHATDLAGNAGDDDVVIGDVAAGGVVVSGLVIDSAAPAPPPTGTPGAVVYTRAPWGDTSSPTPRFAVDAIGLAADAVAVVAFAEGGGAGGAPLARGAVVPGIGPAAGSSSFELPAGDRARVEVATVDVAGNVSAPVAVRDIAFVAALNGKVAGSTLENPHVLEARPSLGRAAVTPLVDERAARELTPAADGIGVVDAARADVEGGVTFARVAPDVTGPDNEVIGTFDPLTHDAFAFDEGDARAFAWSGHGWHDVDAGLGPGRRSGAAMTWDEARARAVMFGGFTGPSIALDELWELDPARGWVLVAGGGAGAGAGVAGVDFPGARGDAALAYDPVDDVTLIVGGDSGSAAVAGVGADVAGGPATLWQWSAGTRTFAKAAPPDPEGDGDPNARERAALAFHRARGVAVLVGGEGPKGDACEQSLLCRDTWQWNGASWARIGGAQPPPRDDAQLAYDDARGVLVLFGGFDRESDVVLGDTWELGATGGWTQVTSAPQPAPRTHALFSADGDGGLVLAAGVGNAGHHDVWRYDGAWRELAADESQPSFDFASLVPSPQGGIALIAPAGAGHETWQRDDGVWRLASSGAPPPKDNASVVFDVARNAVVLFGGLGAVGVTNDTWELDAQLAWQETFTDTATPLAQPSQRKGATVMFDPFLDKVVLLSGLDTNDALVDDAWTYDGAWAPLVGARPRPRAFASVAFDPILDALVLYGGVDQSTAPLGDTWLRDASGWREVFPSQSPPVRAGAGAAFSATLGGVVLFGGQGASSLLAQTWLLRDNIWQMLETSDIDVDGEPDAAAPWQQAAFDAQSDQIVVVVDGEQFAFTAGDRPAAVLHVNAQAALAKPGSVTTSLTVHASAGATGATGGATAVSVDGAEVLLWDGAAFSAVAGTNAAPAGAPSALDVVIDGAAIPPLALAGGAFHLALAARGATTNVSASLSLDAVDAVWLYREP